MAKNKSKSKTLKVRSHVVFSMLMRSQKGGLHEDQKKEANRKACRKPVTQES